MSEVLAALRERLENEQRSSRLSADDPSLSTYQQDLAAMRGWAFGLAISFVDEARLDNLTRCVDTPCEDGATTATSVSGSVSTLPEVTA